LHPTSEAVIADLQARHSGTSRHAPTLDAPYRAGLHLSPTPRLEKRTAWRSLPQLAIPQLGVGGHLDSCALLATGEPTSVINPGSRWAISFTPPITMRPSRLSISEIEAF